MQPQPLSYTTRGRGSTPSQPVPTPVVINQWEQLGRAPLDEVNLSGALDLSTGAQVIDFNAWLTLNSRRLSRGANRDSPRGQFSVELTDECAVTITARLTCELDFNRLAQEVLRLIEPMHR